MGQDLHIKAEQARENGDFLESLKFCDEATIEYSKEGDVQKLAEVQASRSLALRNLAEQMNDKNLLVLAKFAAKSGVKIIEKTGSSSGIGKSLYTLAKCLIDLEKYDKAKEKIQEAIGSGDETLTQAEVLDMKARLATLEYRLGVDGAQAAYDSALSELEGADIDDYTKEVWLSGAYMHMAEAKRSRGEDASELISKAEEIVKSDDKLKIRAEQLSKLQNS